MSENVNEANKRRRQRWTEVRLRMATDLTDQDVIQWERTWTEVHGVYRTLDEWEAIHGVPEQGWYPVNALPDETRMVAMALDWSAPTWVVLELLDLSKSNPGEIATRFVQVYQFEPVTTLSLPAWEPADAGSSDRSEPLPPPWPIWNAVARVYVKQEAATGEAAIATLSDEIVRAGFDVIDGPDYSRAQDAGHGTRQGDQTWHTWLTVVANLRGRDKARAITELRDALRQAGFPTASPQPGDGFLAEDGTEVTTLPGTNQH